MRIGRVVAGMAVVALALGACGSDEEPTAVGDGPAQATGLTSPPDATAPPSPQLSAGLSFRPVVAVLAPRASAEPGDTIDPTPAIEVPPGGVILSDVDPATGAAVADYVLGPDQVDGSVIESATAGLGQYGAWEVNPVLRPGPEGIDAFNELAATCYEKAPSCPTGQLAIVLDGEVLSAPSIAAPDFERDEIVISGAFGEATARELADRLS